MGQDLTNLQVNGLITKDIDLRGRRITNAGDAVNNQDYITKSDLNTSISSITNYQFFLPVNGNLVAGLDQSLRLYINTAFIPNYVRAELKTAPTGANVIISLSYLIGQHKTLIKSLTIPVNSTVAMINGNLPLIPNNSVLILDINQIGSVTSGANLLVTIG